MTYREAIINAILAAIAILAVAATVFLPGLCCASQPVSDVLQDCCDLVEVNHFYDEQGRLVFDQVIFYDWSADHDRYMVRAWRLIKTPSQLPQRDWKRGGYVAVWFDGELLRRVHAGAARETWTQYDPELVEREVLPKEQRRELGTVKVMAKP